MSTIADITLSTLIGGAATILAALSLLPQVIRTWRTRSATDISAAWLLIALISMVLWIAYGILLAAWAITIANAITLVLVVLLLYMKLRFDRAAAPPASSSAP